MHHFIFAIQEILSAHFPGVARLNQTTLAENLLGDLLGVHQRLVKLPVQPSGSSAIRFGEAWLVSARSKLEPVQLAVWRCSHVLAWHAVWDQAQLVTGANFLGRLWKE